VYVQDIGTVTDFLSYRQMLLHVEHSVMFDILRQHILCPVCLVLGSGCSMGQYHLYHYFLTVVCLDAVVGAWLLLLFTLLLNACCSVLCGWMSHLLSDELWLVL